MPKRTMKEIADFVSGTVVTELHVPNNDYPHYYVGEALMAQSLEPGACDPFIQIGFAVKRCAITVDDDYYGENDVAVDSAIHKIVQKNSESLTSTLDEIRAMGPNFSIDEQY